MVTVAVRSRANTRCRMRLRTGTAALAARDGQLDGNLRVGAAQRILEREMHVRRDVVAAHRLAPCARTGAACASAEDAAEQVAAVEAAEVEVAEVDVRSAGGAGTPVLRAIAVVLLALLLIGEHVVGRLHFL